MSADNRDPNTQQQQNQVYGTPGQPPQQQQGEVPVPKFSMLDENEPEKEAGSGIAGWIIFILIFGVGNLILYNTTGWLIIPIPRK
jgi:hypothetical protein